MSRRTVVGLIVGAIVAAAAPVAAAQASSGSHPGMAFKRTGTVSHAAHRKINWNALRRKLLREARKHHVSTKQLKWLTERPRGRRHATEMRSQFRATVASGSDSQISNVSTGAPCIVPVDSPTYVTNDSVSFTNNSDGSSVMTCSGNAGSTLSSSSQADCTTEDDSFGPFTYGPYGAFATFADGEYVGFCADTPTYFFQVFSGQETGFQCEATVGTGANGQSAVNYVGTDSLNDFEIAFHPIGQDYGLYTGIDTTSCVGAVPASVAVPPQPVTHTVACEQPEGFLGAAQGYGVSVTYPDRQYSETCYTDEFLGFGPFIPPPI
jgi:hypothetical protein